MPKYLFEFREVDAGTPCPPGFQDGRTITRGKRAGIKVCVKKTVKATNKRYNINDLTGLMSRARIGEGNASAGAGAMGYSGYGTSARNRSRSRSRSANRRPSTTRRSSRNANAMGGRNRSGSSRSRSRSRSPVNGWGGEGTVVVEADDDFDGIMKGMKKLALQPK